MKDRKEHKLRKRTICGVLALMVLAAVLVKVSGLGDWIKENNRLYCASGNCAMKLYDNNTK